MLFAVTACREVHSTGKPLMIGARDLGVPEHNLQNWYDFTIGAVTSLAFPVSSRNVTFSAADRTWRNLR
jgi:hypothetical protein